MIQIVASIDVKDLEKLARKLHLVPAFQDGIEASAVYIKDVISKYPPHTDANLPGTYPKKWYVRGTGSYWALKDGGVHWKHTSQALGRRWTIKSVDNRMGAVVGNNTSYAIYVHNKPDQRIFHAKRGWLTAQAVAENESKHVSEIIRDFIQAAIDRKE